MINSRVPIPRIGVVDEKLTRPDWTSQTVRTADTIWLDRNENLDPVLAATTMAVLQSLDATALNTYPDLGGLYAKLATVLECEPNQLVLAAGSDGAIRAVYEAYISPGDIVMHSNPTFAMYPVYARMYAADRHPFDYAMSAAGPVLDVERLVRDIRSLRPRLVCLPNPDSPTGTVVGEVELKCIVGAAGEVGAVMLVDEAYYPFYPHSIASWVGENPHLVVTRSFGKAWGLAGVRIGVAITHPDMAVNLHKVRPMYEIGALAAQFLDRMLDHASAVTESVQRNLEGKALFAGIMRELGFKVLMTNGNFIHVAFGDNADMVHQALDGRVLYRRNFPGAALSGYSRFSVAPSQIMEPVAQMIRCALSGA